MDPKLQPHPLSFYGMRSLCERITYKAGWNISLYMDETMHRPVLYVVAEVDDAYKLDKKVKLYIRALVPTYVITTERDFFLWVLQRLQEAEIHECLEFFKVDGDQLFNPHDPVEPPKEEHELLPGSTIHSSRRDEKKES